jgi:hypothetical protein
VTRRLPDDRRVVVRGVPHDAQPHREPTGR